MNEELKKKSIHDLRVMAQAFGVTEIFEKDANNLIKEIEIKQQSMLSPSIEPPPRPQYDARLMTGQPNEIASPEAIVELLTPHIKMGLKLSFEDEHWFMRNGKREDTGTLRMPLRDVLTCAEKILR